MLGTEGAQLTALIHVHIIFALAFTPTKRMEEHQARAAETFDASILLLADATMFASHLLDSFRDIFYTSHSLYIGKLYAGGP